MFSIEFDKMFYSNAIEYFRSNCFSIEQHQYSIVMVFYRKQHNVKVFYGNTIEYFNIMLFSIEYHI